MTIRYKLYQILIVWSLITIGYTEARDLFISPIGNDNTGTGDFGSPFKTINKAVIQANDNDILNLVSTAGAHTFLETQVVNKSLTIIGGSLVATDTVLSLIDATLGPVISISGSVNVTLQNIRLYADLLGTTNSYDVVRINGATNVTFSNVDVLILSDDDSPLYKVNPSITAVNSQYVSFRDSSINGTISSSGTSLIEIIRSSITKSYTRWLPVLKCLPGNRSIVRISDSRMSGHAEFRGVAPFVQRSNFTNFPGDSYDGGCINIFSCYATEILISDSNFQDCFSGDVGGGVAILDTPGPLNIVNSNFVNGLAWNIAGGLFAQNVTNGLVLNNTHFFNFRIIAYSSIRNIASGAAIFANNSQLTMHGGSVKNADFDKAPALFVYDGSAVIFNSDAEFRNVLFADNIGGAVRLHAFGAPNLEDARVQVSFDGCVFRNNTGDSDVPVGGLRVSRAFSDVKINNCTFDGNSYNLANGAAAMLVSGSDTNIAVTNTIFTRNVGFNRGSTVVVSSPTADATFLNCTFSSNVVDTGSGAILVLAGTLRVLGSNTVFRNNSFLGGDGARHLFAISDAGPSVLITEASLAFSPLIASSFDIRLDGISTASTWTIMPTIANQSLLLDSDPAAYRVVVGYAQVNCSLLFCSFGSTSWTGGSVITVFVGPRGADFGIIRAVRTTFTIKSDDIYADYLPAVRNTVGLALADNSRLQLDAVNYTQASGDVIIGDSNIITLNFRSEMHIFAPLTLMSTSRQLVLRSRSTNGAGLNITTYNSVTMSDVSIIIEGVALNFRKGPQGLGRLNWGTPGGTPLPPAPFTLQQSDLESTSELRFDPDLPIYIYPEAHDPVLDNSVRFITSDTLIADVVQLNASGIKYPVPDKCTYNAFQHIVTTGEFHLYVRTDAAPASCGQRPSGNYFYCNPKATPVRWTAGANAVFASTRGLYNITTSISLVNGSVLEFQSGSQIYMSLNTTITFSDNLVECVAFTGDFRTTAATMTIQFPNATLSAEGVWGSLLPEPLFTVPTFCSPTLRTAISEGRLLILPDVIGQNISRTLGCQQAYARPTLTLDFFTFSCTGPMPPPIEPPTLPPVQPPATAQPLQTPTSQPQVVGSPTPPLGDSFVASGSSPVGAIVGGIIAALAVIGIILLVLFILRRRRGAATPSSTKNHDPFEESNRTEEMAPLAESATTPEHFTPRITEPIATTPPTQPPPQSIIEVDGAIPLSDVTFMQELGKGSWGVVSLALYKGEFVAVKRVSSGAPGTQLATLMDEARMMSSIKAHRNLVKFIGICSDSASLGLMMEFCPRGSLIDYLRSNKGAEIPEYDLFKFVYGVLEGMIALAFVGLVHRDLAARNVLLDERIFTKVSDFGSSRRSTELEAEIVTQDDTLGPIKWQPPEVLDKQTYSEKSDVWSFGCTLLEIFTRREPYSGYTGNLLQLIQDIQDGRINPLVHAEKMGGYNINSWPVWVVPTLRSCFESDPDKRPTFREIRFRINPKARKHLDAYEAEIDEFDSVLSTQHYSSVPAGAMHSKSSWNPASATTASTTNNSTEVIAATGDVADLGSVERQGKLGEGSFGTVYLGKYKGQYVAIKVLNLTSAGGQAVLREAEVMSSISQHRNIVQLFGIVKENDHIDIVMEFAPKGSCEDYVASSKGKKIGEALLFKWALGIARGMAHLTASKVIHRDLSARNVLLDSLLEPKIADFGLGRTVLDPNQESSTQTDVGPLRWFAPECFDLKYSEKTDVWAYGCTLIELATGALPFPSKSIMDVFLAVRDAGATPLDELPPSVPSWLLKTMQKCFARNAKDRATFVELVSFIEAQADSIDEIREAEAAIQRRRNQRAGTMAV